MAELSDFHRDVARMELDFAMQSLRDFTETAGALNWRENTALDTVMNAANLHPLKTNVQRLAEWLDAYDAGTATRDEWVSAIKASMDANTEVRWFLFERQNHENPEWQLAKLIAAASIEKEQAAL